MDIRDCRSEYKKEVLNAVSEMFVSYTELKGQVKSIKCGKMSKNVYAAYQAPSRDESFGGHLILNTRQFSSPNLKKKLLDESVYGLAVPNASPKSIVMHELGHGLQLGLCANANNVTIGQITDKTKHEKTVTDYMKCEYAKEIVESACAECGVEFGSSKFKDELTHYAARSYGEALAEAVSEVGSSREPRILARTICSRLRSYQFKGGD